MGEQRDLYCELIGKLKAGKMTQTERMLLANYVRELEALLDETDQEDFFGTQGWRYRQGVE